jgi:thiamine kinase
VNPDHQIKARLAEIPFFADFDIAGLEVSKLPGLTNHNYRISTEECDWVLRIPKTETNHYIDRNAEAHNQRLAHKIEIAPLWCWRDDGGSSVTAMIPAAAQMDRQSIANPQNLLRLATSISLLHSSSVNFQGEVSIGPVLESYYSMLTAGDKKRLQARFTRAQGHLSRLIAGDDLKVPSHNDLVMENLLLAGGELWVIDWEYSAMASPYWDLATVCNAADFDNDQSERFLAQYNQTGKSLESTRLHYYRELIALLSDCWLAHFNPEATLISSKVP